MRIVLTITIDASSKDPKSLEATLRSAAAHLATNVLKGDTAGEIESWNAKITFQEANNVEARD